MYVCGYNSFKQLDGILPSEDSEMTGSIREFRPALKKNVTHVAFAWNHVVLVEKGESIFINGFMGNGIKSMFRLEQVPFSVADIHQVVCSREKLFCVTTDGQAWEYNYASTEWRNLKALLPLSEVEGLELRVVKFAVGVTFAAVLMDDGRVYTLPSEALPVPPELGSVADLACGHEHGILLTSTGQVMTWGTALRGQLGNDNVDTSPEPTEVHALAGIKCVSIAAGGWHSCAISSDGDLYTWGWNKFGQLGLPRPQDDLDKGISVAYLPVVVDFPLEAPVVKTVFCGTGHTIVSLHNGELWGCGWNKYGQLGLGEEEFVSSMKKLPVPPDFEIKTVVCGSWNSAVIS
uniref:RCC1 domain-containing protein 1 n=3 Tax=Lygus hesperus TaxID=30085 RepID=A0A146LTV1_LYGHE